MDYKDKPTSKILEISEKRRVFTSEELDYTCVEIFEKDNIFNNNEIEKLFKIDQNILEENSSKNNNIDIFILQYPKGNEISLSSGKIKSILGNEIYHTATTIEGSSGSPIIIRDNYSIIGLHFGSKISEKKKGLMDFNLGTNIIGIINDIKNNISKNQKKLIKIEDNSKLEILDRKEYIKKFKENDKLNLIKFESKNFVLLNSINPIFEPTPYFWSDYIIKGRFLPEIKKLKKDFLTNEGFQIYGIIGNKLIGVMEGPPGTAYENGFFLFEIMISQDYPFKFGKFYFKTKIFHPNIDENGLLSLDKIQDEWWTPALTFGKVILSVQSLLDSPNPDDFLNQKASKLYKENRYKYEETVKEYTSKYANFISFENELSKYELKIEHIK